MCVGIFVTALVTTVVSLLVMVRWDAQGSLAVAFAVTRAVGVARKMDCFIVS